MDTRSDISSREDIEHIVRSFYDRVLNDEELAPFFTEVVVVDWDAHLPKMFDFWEGVVFGTGNFKGNPMQVHLKLHLREKLSQQLFKKWLELFSGTIDSLHSGEKANLIKTRALSIATMMQMRIYGMESPRD